MKRYGDLYKKICDLDNLALAHKKAKRGKSSYKEVQMVNKDEIYYLAKIQDMLTSQTYETSKYKIFTINDKGKEREIYKLPYFPDRIVHHAVMNIIEPIFMGVFTNDTYASLKGRGIHSALSKLKNDLKNQEGTKYCLKIDIKKFFPNINHFILKSLLRKKFKDKKLLWLMDEIIDSVGGDVGVPIGNYMSQYYANFCLAYFDHWIKEYKSVKYYYRYMDDMVFLHNDKEYLHKLQHEIIKYLSDNLQLELKDNRQVFPTHIKGLDFIGYRYINGHFVLRKSIAKRFKRKMIKIKKRKIVKYSDINTIASYNGWLKWCESQKLLDKYVKPIKTNINKTERM